MAYGKAVEDAKADESAWNHAAVVGSWHVEWVNAGHH
jgi:hypothetical protein